MEEASDVWCEIAPGAALPESYVYVEYRPEGPLGARVHMRVIDGRLICEKLELTPTPEAEISTTSMRSMHVSPLIQRATATFVSRISFDPKHPLRGDEIKVRPLGAPGGPIRRIRRAWKVRAGPFMHQLAPPEERRTAAAAISGRSARVIPKDLQEVRDVYVEAEKKREHPTKAVKKRFDVSPATASRWVREARELGLLEPYEN
jgi:hypothetical protein